MKMKMMKVFDCQEMPEEIRRFFFDYIEAPGNDCYIDFQIGEYIYPDDEEDREWVDTLNEWLIEQGADPDENVLIRYWW